VFIKQLGLGLGYGLHIATHLVFVQKNLTPGLG